MKEHFRYDGKIYKSEEDVDEAIIEKIGHNYNNMDVTQTSEFQYEVDKIETVTVDEATDHTPENTTYSTVEPMATTDRLADKHKSKRSC